MKYIFQILALLSVASSSFGEVKYNQYGQNYNSNKLEWSGYTYNINEGQCRGKKLVDEGILKNADPYTIKKTTYTWVGRDMFFITCIKVMNRMHRDEKAGEARITSGGIGEGKVSIEMVSKNSQRLQFQVEIWGEETSRQSENYAVLSNTPDKILYMGGKKYCECH